MLFWLEPFRWDMLSRSLEGNNFISIHKVWDMYQRHSSVIGLKKEPSSWVDCNGSRSKPPQQGRWEGFLVTPVIRCSIEHMSDDTSESSKVFWNTEASSTTWFGWYNRSSVVLVLWLTSTAKVAVQGTVLAINQLWGQFWWHHEIMEITTWNHIPATAGMSGWVRDGNYIVSKLGFFTYLQDVSNLLI